MAEPKSNMDMFGSYLSRVQSGSAKQAVETPGSAGASAEMTVLHALRSASGPVSVKALLGQVELPPSVLMKTLQALEESKLVGTSMAGTDERVSLTGLGRTIVE